MTDSEVIAATRGPGFERRPAIEQLGLLLRRAAIEARKPAMDYRQFATENARAQARAQEGGR